jgi:hypothetical protein
MDEDEDAFPRWHEEKAPARRQSERVGASEALLIPLARAQGAVARLEAAGFLAHRGPAVHPHDLALRDANFTGSPRSSNHACSEPSICTSSPTQSRRRRG